MGLKAQKKIGLPPGSLVYVGDKEHESINISIVEYSPNHINIIENATIEDAQKCQDNNLVSWINVSGIHNIDFVNNIGKIFDIHPLVIEDILNTEHMSKIDDFDDYLFVVLKMIDSDPKENILNFEHICIVVGETFLISFQDREKNVFKPVIERLKKTKNFIRRSGTDYLSYALIDMVVDHYFFIFEHMEEKIELLQEETIENPTSNTLNAIQELKHQMIWLRKAILPLREMIRTILKGESSLIDYAVIRYFQDVYDHVIQAIETIDTNRDILAGITGMYMSSVSNKMNEVMKVLTMIATIFIPVTFFAGVYGMNFKYLPELDWRYSYIVFWTVVILIFFIMIIWFKRKKWF